MGDQVREETRGCAKFGADKCMGSSGEICQFFYLRRDTSKYAKSRKAETFGAKMIKINI